MSDPFERFASECELRVAVEALAAVPETCSPRLLTPTARLFERQMRQNGNVTRAPLR